MKSSTKLKLIWAGVIVAVVVLCVFSCQSVQNSAIALEEQINTAQSDIDIYQKRRADLLPNLVDCVKQYDKHEAEVLKQTVEARGNNITGSELKTLLNAVHEAYPQLQSNSNYQKLMTELVLTENKMANVRENYNKWVKDYKRSVRKFPNSTILSMLGYEIIDFEYLKFDAPVDAPTNLFGDK